MVLDVRRMLPLKKEYRPEASILTKLWYGFIEWSNNNEDYGLIFVDEKVWQVIKWFFFPLAAYFSAQKIPTGGNYTLVNYFIMSIAWAQFVTMVFIRTRPANWLVKGEPPKPMKIDSIIKISPDTFLFRMDLEKAKQPLGLPIMQHLIIHAPNDEMPAPTVEGKWNSQPEEDCVEISRKYTPVSVDGPYGNTDLVIKVYHPNANFCDGGKVGRWLMGKKPGDKLMISGPVGKYEYVTGGGFKDSLRKETYWNFKEINMVAGGSGITPIIQIINGVLNDRTADGIHMNLIFGNKSIEDILCKPILDKLLEQEPDRLRIHYTVDKVDDSEKDSWTGSVGYVTHDMLSKHMAPSGKDTLWFFCGPQPLKTIGKDFAIDQGQDVKFIWGA